MKKMISQAFIAHQEGRLKEAEQLYQSILKNQPTNLDVNNNLGVILQNQGRFNEAIACYKKAIELKPDYATAHNNLGIVQYRIEKLDEAKACYKKAIELKPDYTAAHNNLGIVLKDLDRFDEAEACYKKAIELKPDYETAHNNLGIVLKDLDRFDEAEACYKKAIEFKPDYAEAHNNLGIVLKDLDRFDEAEACYKKAIELKPDYAEAHNNLGNIWYELGKIDKAAENYKKAIQLKSDFVNAWHNILFPLQIIKLQDSSFKDYSPFLNEQVNCKYAQINKSILHYRLNLGGLSSNNSLNEVLSILSLNDDFFIKNPKVTSHELTTKLTPPKKITALVHFGRSGTGLMHSLIDGHPEVSTLPSIYFSEFFNNITWKKIIAGGWEEVADRFATIYEVLFDSFSAAPIAAMDNQFIIKIGQKEGMTNVGKEGNEALSLDKKVFTKELKKLMNYYNRLDQFTFFMLVHSAYEKTLDNHKEKNHTFYHIHNPGTFAQLNFLRLAPDTRWLMMVREPLQSCESWIRNSVHNNDYNKIVNKIFEMLFKIDQPIFQNKNSIGVRLEDLKKHPKKTILTLCSWLGIREEDSLYQMTAQGKKWWGDPSSPVYKEDGMDPFGKASINRKLGSVFSENDQYILHTLFYPFSVRFGYAKENLEKFKNDLQTIRPLLDQMFDFEKKIIQDTKVSSEKFMKSGTYLYLRSGLIERWNTLNKFHTYPNMLTPLRINQF